MYQCPNPECNNTDDFRCDSMTYSTDHLNAAGEHVDTKLYDSEQTGPVECNWCHTEATTKDKEVA